MSPVLHRAAYAALGLTDWRYDAIECDIARLPAFVGALDSAWAGLSLTMPLKRAALDVASSASDLTLAVGAANTLLPRQAGWHAENTDIHGIRAALVEGGVGGLRSAVVLGGGGTAQAALAALAALGVRTPTVLVRDEGRVGDLLAAAARLDVQPRIGPWPVELPPADLVISTVPAGAADAVASGPWLCGGSLLDVVYSPWPTPLAVGARAGGVRVIGGLSVLLHQACAQVELMTGHTAPIEQMRAALTAAL